MRATSFHLTSDMLVLSLAQSNRKPQDKGVEVMESGDRPTHRERHGHTDSGGYES